MDNLKLIVVDNIQELGEEVNKELMKLTKSENSHILKTIRSRFSNGEGKMAIKDTVRDKDIYILSDVGNYDITYEMHGFQHRMGPDEHFQDIIRTISALSGYPTKITLISPLLYASRQHKRKGRESLDCAIALRQLESLGVNHVITFDAHDPNVCNAIPNLPFENIYPTHTILEKLINDVDLDNILVISPDMGAMERARYYAEMLSTDVGVFYKRRDLTTVVNGKNPIVEHAYMGAKVRGKTVIVVDDMIASGGSLIEVGQKLRKKGAKEIIFIATFALFTEGIDNFKKAYKKHYFDKLYTTNLTYIPDEYKEVEWLKIVNCSKSIAKVIYALHNGDSIKKIINDQEKMFKKIEKKKESQN